MLVSPESGKGEAHSWMRTCVSWPNFADIQRPIGVKHKGVDFYAAIVCSIRIAGIIRVRRINGSIYNGNKMLPVFVKLAQELSRFFIAIWNWIIGEIPVLNHVVDVGCFMSACVQ